MFMTNQEQNLALYAKTPFIYYVLELFFTLKRIYEDKDFIGRLIEYIWHSNYLQNNCLNYPFHLVMPCTQCLTSIISSAL